MVTHIVLFKFENLAYAEEARARLLDMRSRISSLLELEAGLDFTRSERSYELGLITRHRDRQALEAYRADPVHLAVAAYIREHGQGSAAVDFETAD